MKKMVLPAVLLWILTVGLVLAYYLVPSVAAALGSLADWQGAHRLVGSMAGRVLFCGLIPGAFLLAQASIRPKRPWLTILSTTLWNVVWAIPFDLFYRFQAVVFGEGDAFATLLGKMLVDQFVWTVVLVAPANAAFFLWAGMGFSRGGLTARELLVRWRMTYRSNLIANWFIWIPVVLAIYIFPTDLQIHVSGLVGSFWTLLCLELGHRAADVQ